MKNLKRVLSLALTGVMLVGMMAIGASAANKDFTDKDEIVNVEAVDVMSTLGVLKGKDTGAFDPKATVTRAEMAKIITVMLNGGNDPTLGSTSNVMFTDIANHWAKSYIQYCANLGIIAGQGDGTFAPDAPVTGAAAAKMLLVALGYDADIAGYQGADWDLNVNRDANEAKLYDGIKSIDTSAGLSRDNTAQMAYNALEAKIMERTDHKVVGTGEVSYTYEQSKTTTFLNKYFDAQTFIGKMDGNSNNIDGLTKGYIQVTGDLDTADTDSKDYNQKVAKFPSDLDIANIGEQVKVIFKDGKSGQTGKPDKNDTIYGVFNTGKTEVINVTMADVKDNKADEAKIKLDDTKYSLAEVVTVYTNYQEKGAEYKGTQLKGSDTKGSEKNSALTTALQGSNGNTIKFVCDEDGDIDRAYVVTSKLAVVTTKNATKVSLNNGVGTLTIADHDIYDGIAKDDVVVVTTLYAAKATDDKAFNIVEKAETAEGEVIGYKNDKDTAKNESVTLDSTSYKVLDKADMFITGIDDAVKQFTDGSSDTTDHIGEDFKVYLVNGYVAAAVKTSVSASNYSVILEVSNGKSGSTFDALQLRVMDAAGTKSTITVAEDDKGNEVSKDTYATGDIITYTMNKDNEAVVTLKGDLSENKSTATTGYVKKTKEFNDITVATDAVMFVATGLGNKDQHANVDIKAYNLRGLGDVPLKEDTDTYKWVAVLNKDETKVLAVYVDLGKKPSGAASSTVYGVISAYNGTQKVDGTNYKQYVADVNGEKYTLNVLRTRTDLDTGLIVKFDPVSDNIYSGATDVTVVNKAVADKVVIGFADGDADADGILTVANKATGTKDAASGSVTYELSDKHNYVVDKDTKVYYVDADGKAGMESGSIGSFDSVNGYNNIILILDTDKKTVTDMIVEVGGAKDLVKGVGRTEPEEPAEHVHELTWKETKGEAATCAKDGSVGYWTATCKGAGDDCKWNAETKYDKTGTATDKAADAKVVTDTKIDKSTVAHTVATWAACTDTSDAAHNGTHHSGTCSVCSQTIYEAHDFGDSPTSGTTTCTATGCAATAP